jgi:hypothetical protein
MLESDQCRPQFVKLSPIVSTIADIIFVLGTNVGTKTVFPAISELRL